MPATRFSSCESFEQYLLLKVMVEKGFFEKHIGIWVAFFLGVPFQDRQWCIVTRDRTWTFRRVSHAKSNTWIFEGWSIRYASLGSELTTGGVLLEDVRVPSESSTDDSFRDCPVLRMQDAEAVSDISTGTLDSAAAFPFIEGCEEELPPADDPVVTIF